MAPKTSAAQYLKEHIYHVYKTSQNKGWRIVEKEETLKRGISILKGGSYNVMTLYIKKKESHQVLNLVNFPTSALTLRNVSHSWRTKFF